MTDKPSDNGQQTEILPESVASSLDDDATELISDSDSDDQATELLAAESDAATELLAPLANEGSGHVQAPALEPGATLKERFYLEKKLGEGGMGAVYLARDQRKVEAKHSNPYVAVKLISGDFSQDARAFIALQRETDKSQTLAHPNIITVYDFDRDGDVFFMTMEALSGDTLETLIENPQREASELVRYIAALASGISYAHQRNIVHSDIKPANIFLTSSGQLKILDFGIARALSSVDGASASPSDGEVVGLSPAYASCEMFARAEPHPADDVFAIGLLAYELLTGEHPFGRKRATEAKKLGLKPKKIKSITAYQWEAIAKALAFDRADRWPDAEAFYRKFTGVGRRVRQLSAALVVAVLSFTVYLSFFDEDGGPDIPFDALPIATQAMVQKNIDEAGTALSFSDLNGALFYLDKAYSLHPRNRRVMTILEDFINPVLKDMESNARRDGAGAYLQQLEELMKYPFLAQHPRLVDMKKHLQSLPL